MEGLWAEGRMKRGLFPLAARTEPLWEFSPGGPRYLLRPNSRQTLTGREGSPVRFQKQRPSFPESLYSFGGPGKVSQGRQAQLRHDEHRGVTRGLPMEGRGPEPREADSTLTLSRSLILSRCLRRPILRQVPALHKQP